MRTCTGLPADKATGHDNINAVFVKNAGPSFCNSFAAFVNQCVTTGIFPSELKIARVAPIYKQKGDAVAPENNRPVSILPVLSKLIEKFLANQLIEHIELNQLLNTHQSGFRRRHGTATALHHVLDRWATDISQKNASPF